MNHLAKFVSGLVPVLALAACGPSAEPEGTESNSASSALQAPPSYNLAFLPILSGIGSNACVADGIDPTGTYIVGDCWSDAYAPYPVYWKKTTTWTVSRIAPNIGPVLENFHINSRDQLAGAYIDDGLLGPTSAFFLAAPTSTNVVIIPKLPGYASCQATGINDFAEVMGECYNNGSYAGFKWTQSGGLAALPVTPGCTSNRTRWIRSDGTILVQSSDCQDGSVRNFKVLPSGATSPIANACRSGQYLGANVLRDDGTIGGFCRGVNNNHEEYKNAVIVSSAGLITYIYNVTTPAPATWVLGMPTSNSAVGTNNVEGGFVYTGGVAYDLNHLFGSIGSPISNVMSVNVRGQIVGQGSSAAGNPAYVLTPN
jgi:hypothetical protein